MGHVFRSSDDQLAWILLSPKNLDMFQNLLESQKGGRREEDEEVLVSDFESWKMIWHKEKQVESSNINIGTGEMDENVPDSFVSYFFMSNDNLLYVK